MYTYKPVYTFVLPQKPYRSPNPDLETSLVQEPWWNLATRLFQNDDGDTWRSIAEYETQLKPRVPKFLKMALDSL